eukprot:COSAG01_NODE_9482_length_2435_cov_1.681079_1_plen_88_part_00
MWLSGPGGLAGALCTSELVLYRIDAASHSAMHVHATAGWLLPSCLLGMHGHGLAAPPPLLGPCLLPLCNTCTTRARHVVAAATAMGR